MTAEANKAVGEDIRALREDIAQLRNVLAQLRQDIEAERSKQPLTGPQAQTPEETERAREQTRGRIAYALIGTLVAVVVATIGYIAWLSGVGGLAIEDVNNVMQGLGTTLLAPIVGLIGAVIGFYYGRQTAVQGTQSATQAATVAARQAATDVVENR
jgi:hypothetical protein